MQKTVKAMEEECASLVQDIMVLIDEFKALVNDITVNKSVYLKCAFFLVELKHNLHSFQGINLTYVRNIAQDIRDLHGITKRSSSSKSRILLLYTSHPVAQNIQATMKSLGIHLHQMLQPEVIQSEQARQQVGELTRNIQSATFTPDSGNDELVASISKGLQVLQIDEQYASHLSQEITTHLGVTLTSLQSELTEDKRLLEARHEEAGEVDKLLLLLETVAALAARNQALEDSVDIPPSFYCPITGQVMREPVLIESGLTYEKSAILEWFHHGNDNCPITNIKLNSFSLVPNRSLESAIIHHFDRLQIDRLTRSIKTIKQEQVDVKDAVDTIKELLEGNYNFKRHVVALDGVEPLVRLVRSSDASQRRKILQILASIAGVGDDCKLLIVRAGGVPVLLRVLNKCHGDDPDAVKLLEEISETREGKEAILVEKGSIITVVSAVNTDSPEQKFQALNLLDNLCKTNAWVAIEAASTGLFHPLINNLQEGDELTKLEMADAIATKLQLNEASLTTLVSTGAVPPLLNILKTGSFESKVAAVNALQKLSASRGNKLTISEAGAIPVLLSLLPVKQLQVHALQSLANLVAERECAAALSRDCQVSLFTSLMNDKQVQEQSLRILHLLAKESKEVRKALIVDQSTMKVVPTLLQKCTPSCRTSVLGLLFQLSADKVTRDGVKLSSDTVNLLFSLLDQANPIEDKEFALGILAGASKDGIEAKEAITSANFYGVIVRCMQSGSPKMKEAALALLTRLTDPSLNSRLELLYSDFAKLDVMNLLKKALENGTDRAKEHAAANLANLSGRAPGVTERLSFLKRILAMLRLRQFKSCAVHIGKCNPVTSFCMVEGGVVPLLIRETENPSVRTVEKCVQALLALLEDESGRGRAVDFLVKSGVISPLVRVVGRSPRSTEKAMTMLEMIFKCRRYRDAKYSKIAKSSLSTTMTSGTMEARRSAAKALMHLGMIPKASTYTTETG